MAPRTRFAGESTINFLSNEDTQELAPGFFIKIVFTFACGKMFRGLP
jgi:hypothetical protein